MTPWFGFVIMLGFAYFFHRAAVFESLDRPYVWGGAAALLYVFSIHYLDFGLAGALSVQFGLFVWMGAWNSMHRNRKGIDHS